MGSSEDYLDSLLRSMGVPAELASPTKKETAPAKEPEVKEPEAVTDAPKVVITEEAPAEEPVAEEPVVEEAVVEEAVVEEPIAEEPVVQEPIKEHFSDILSVDTTPAVEQIVEEPVIEEPVVESVAEESSPIEEEGPVQLSIDDLLAGIPDISPDDIVNEEPAAETEPEAVSEPELILEPEPMPETEAVSEPEPELILEPEPMPEEEPVLDHSADIPDLAQLMNEEPVTDIHIDSAPSLDITDDTSSVDDDLSDLMSGLMSKIEAEEEAENATAEVAEAEPEIALEPVYTSMEDLMNAVSVGDMSMEEAAEYVKEHGLQTEPEEVPAEEPVAETASEEPIEEAPADEPVSDVSAEESPVEETAPVSDEVSAEAGDIMSDADLMAMIDSLNLDEITGSEESSSEEAEPAPEPEPEPEPIPEESPIEGTDLTEDVIKMLDDIEGKNDKSDETPIEVTTDENGVVHLDLDDSLMAILNETEEASAEETPEEEHAEEVPEEESEPEPEVLEGTDLNLSDIEALINETAEKSSEESVPDEIPAESADTTESAVEEKIAEEPSPDDTASSEAALDDLLAGMLSENEDIAEEIPHGDGNLEDDLDAQLAALLDESGVSEEGGSSPEPAAESSESSDDFDLDAELAELMKEENESADLPGEDDIEAMLNKAKAEGLADDGDRSDMSLDELLAADSGAASDIEDLLNKNENNEAVDPGIEALLNGSDEEQVPDVLGEEPEEAAPVDKKAERKRLREEKKEARRKAREEKARLRKEAKEAKKAGKKSAAGVGKENELASENSGNADMSDVDALLAGAESAAAAAREASLSSDAVPIPRENREEAAEPEVAESTPVDEADSLLAEIMGNSFEEEDAGLGDLLNEGMDEMPAEAPAEEAPAGISEDELGDLIDKNTEEKPKKKGFFARILEALTETDEDEESAEGAEIKLSDENAEVLEQLEAEGEGDGGKKKKKKKDKKKKGKGGDEPSAEDMEGVGDEVDKDAKKGKKKKEKKPKPEKEAADEKPSKKLNKKKVISVFALCITILVAVLIVSNLMGSYTLKREARQAYSDGDYQTAYQDLFGQDLNESDEIIFKKSECILRIRLWYREYEMLKDESDVKALDSLIQTVSRYPGLYASAVKWQCLDDVEPLYLQMVDALWNDFGITEEEAIEIAMIKKDVDYTRAVYEVVNRRNGVIQDEPAPEDELLTPPEPDPLDDPLPGEEDPGQDIIFINP